MDLLFTEASFVDFFVKKVGCVFGSVQKNNLSQIVDFSLFLPSGRHYFLFRFFVALLMPKKYLETMKRNRD